ncbi:MAG TPA: hypothetical protein VGH95_04025 [Candidatus Aquirickettsiella sp.]|jgi:hypothetical protein
MLGQLLNQMDEYLSSKPFKRRWWSRGWIVYMTIQPPVTQEYPLWKRNKGELRLLRLFDLRPEQLQKKIERYWKKPRWRRWLASFGMNKKIDVWNYYQRCLAYQAVRLDQLKQESFIANKSEPILEDLSMVLNQSTIKFEAYLEKHCRNRSWIEKHSLKKIKAYKQKLKKLFLSKLNKLLQQIRTEGDRFTLKQQAEQEFQQVEGFMFHYHSLWLNSLFPRITPSNRRLEVGVDAIQNENLSTELSLADNNCLPTISSSSPILRTTIYQTDISLHRSKEWIRAQREQLNLLLQEGSLQKVEDLLQAGLNDIKMITELHLGFCDTMLSDVQDKEEGYHKFLNYLDNLQRQLKPLLQGGMLLFHPDHVLNLTHSQAMKELITRYSQAYLEQSRCYLDSLKNYHLRIEEFYLLDPQKLQRTQLLRECSDLARRIQELAQSIKELKQSFKDFAKELREVETKRAQDKEAMEAQRERDKEAMEAQRERDKADSEARLKELEEKFEAKLDKLFTPASQQQTSTQPGTDAEMPKASNAHLLKP